MPVERVPGFWDYLNQGIEKGLGQYRENQQIKREETRANAGLMTQLFEAGATDSSSLQGAINATGMKGVNILPSKAERRKKVLAGGQAAIDALNDEDKRDLGFMTSTEKAVDAAKASGATLEVRRNDALQRFMSGEDLDDNNREILGIMTKSDRELKKLTQMDPYLGQLGERHVAGELMKSNGRIPEGGLKAIAENAYANYVAERSANGMGGLTPEQVTYTRTFFQRAAMNALIAQKKMDLEDYASKTARIGATSMADSRGINSNLQWFGKITTAKDAVRKQQQDLLRANPALGFALDNPQMAANPMFAGAIERYKQLEETAEAFTQAQGDLAQGNVPGNLSVLLDAAGGMITPPAATAGAAGKTPGAAPAAAAAPAKPAGPAPGPTPGVATDVDQKMEATAQALAKGQIGTASLEPYVLTGAITRDQVAKITKRAEAIKKEMDNNKMKGIAADTFSSGGVRRRY